MHYAMHALSHLALFDNVVRIATRETRTFKNVHYISFPKRAKTRTRSHVQNPEEKQQQDEMNELISI